MPTKVRTKKKAVKQPKQPPFDHAFERRSKRWKKKGSPVPFIKEENV